MWAHSGGLFSRSHDAMGSRKFQFRNWILPSHGFPTHSYVKWKSWGSSKQVGSLPCENKGYRETPKDSSEQPSQQFPSLLFPHIPSTQGNSGPIGSLGWW